MAIGNKNPKPPGSFYNNNGRWAWKVKLPGETKRRTISLVPPGQKVALRYRPETEPDAWRVAWRILRQHTTSDADGLTVSNMAKAYHRYVSKTLSPQRCHSIDISLRWLTSDYAARPADSISLEEMRDIREALKARYVRKSANTHLRTIQRCYAWARDEGYVDAYAANLICSFGLIPSGTKCGGKHRDIQPVAAADVAATLDLVTPTMRDMVIVQWVCDMRPGEVCIMRPCDIDTSDNEMWLYEPQRHKNTHRGQNRIVAVFPEAREIIERRVSELGLQESDYLFSPEQSEKERRQEVHSNRKTPLKYGNRPGTNDKGLQQFGEHYTSDAYGKHIRRAISDHNATSKTKIKPWSPNLLRHSKATENRALYGRNIAAALLGHSPKSDAVDIYTRQAIKDEFREKAKAELREVAKKISRKNKSSD